MKYIDENGRVFEVKTSQDSLLERLYGSFLGRCIVRIIASPWVSRLGGWLLSRSASRVLIKGFVKRNNIDLSLYEKQKFKSYNDFFTRKIKSDKRPVDKDENALVSPSDGKVSVYELDEKSVFEIKNSKYNCESLLKNEKLGKKFKNGYAFVIRLTVDDYHRYCYACDGHKGENVRIEGIFHTVNPVAFEHYKVFKENTREYCEIASEKFGEVVQMEVGATLVGKISNLHKGGQRVFKGSEKGKFEFGGSTIVLLVQNEAVARPKTLLNRTKQGIETVVKQGQALAYKK